jgi:uncharacterized protein (TIGR02646 family)
MKFISKDPEPLCFTDWKNLANEEWKPTWENFRSPQKPEVQCALIREQGYICCYCQSRIDRSSSHIEHFAPRSLFEMLRLDYCNLLASCNCGEKKRGLSDCDEDLRGGEVDEIAVTAPSHCGKFKDQKYDEDLISPLHRDCETYFRYDETGRIKPSEDPEKAASADASINAFGLNSMGLTAERKRRIVNALEEVDFSSSEEIRWHQQYYNQKDENGRFTPFCAAVVYVLKQYLTP